MNREPLTTIERSVESWPGVTTGDTGRGGLQFDYTPTQPTPHSKHEFQHSHA